MILKDLINIIRTEPELPGEPTENLRTVFKGIMESQDEAQLVSVMRQVVQQTKVSIMKRIIEHVEQETLV